MVLNYILAITLGGLAGYDAWLTQKRIEMYGVSVELNAAIRWLTNKLGVEIATGLGILVPTLGLMSLCLMLHLQWVLALLVGFRGRVFFNQVESKVFEKEIKDFINQAWDPTSPSR